MNEITSIYRIAIIMTCFNRKELTKQCLYSLNEDLKENEDINADFFVVDDGSTDGTSDMIKTEFPNVHILKGDGNLFWNGGMYLGFEEAMKYDYDYYLWVNDDVKFEKQIIKRLLSFSRKMGEKLEIQPIISGYTVSKDKKTVTYGGQRDYSKIIPLNLKNIIPREGVIEECDAINGNCVLIPREVTKIIGNIDPFYTHSFGDTDYGLRASRRGIKIYLTDFPVGICEMNPILDRKIVFRDKTLKERFKIFSSVKHRPTKDWLHYTKKFGGVLWFLRFIAPYIKLALNIY